MYLALLFRVKLCVNYTGSMLLRRVEILRNWWVLDTSLVDLNHTVVRSVCKIEIHVVLLLWLLNSLIESAWQHFYYLC